MPKLPTNLLADIRGAAPAAGPKARRPAGAGVNDATEWLLALLASAMPGKAHALPLAVSTAAAAGKKTTPSETDRPRQPAVTGAVSGAVTAGKILPPIGSAVPHTLLEGAGAARNDQRMPIDKGAHNARSVTAHAVAADSAVESGSGPCNPDQPVSQANAQWLRAALQAMTHRGCGSGDQEQAGTNHSTQPSSLAALQHILPPAAAAVPTAANSQAPVHSVAQPLPAPSDPGFGAAVENRVAWMVSKGVEHAQIEVHPRELGPVTIRMHLSVHGADVSMAAAHPDTRQALMAAAPRLGELFAAAGLVLNEARVSDPSVRRTPVRARQEAAADPVDISPVDTDTWHTELVDHFV